METVRIRDVNGHPMHFFIVSGLTEGTSQQTIDIHRLTTPNQDKDVALDVDNQETKVVNIKRIKLSSADELKCFTTHARLWMQYSKYLYYFKSEHEESKIVIHLWRYDLDSNTEEKLDQYPSVTIE